MSEEAQLFDVGVEVGFFIFLASIVVLETYLVWLWTLDNSEPSPLNILVENEPDECLMQVEADMAARGFVLTGRGRSSVTFVQRTNPGVGPFLILLFMATLPATIYMLLGFVDVAPTIEMPSFDAPSPSPSQAEIELTGIPRDLGSGVGWLLAGLTPLFVYSILLALLKKYTAVSAIATEDGTRLSLVASDKTSRSLLETWATRKLTAKNKSLAEQPKLSRRISHPDDPA